MKVFHGIAIVTAAVILLFGIVALRHSVSIHCTESDKALSQAPSLPIPTDDADARTHPEKLQYDQTQVRAIQKCGF